LKADRFWSSSLETYFLEMLVTDAMGKKVLVMRSLCYAFCIGLVWGVSDVGLGSCILLLPSSFCC
jgi:hypothetical protein